MSCKHDTHVAKIRDATGGPQYSVLPGAQFLCTTPADRTYVCMWPATGFPSALASALQMRIGSRSTDVCVEETEPAIKHDTQHIKESVGT